jgi:hypothetical protein
MRNYLLRPLEKLVGQSVGLRYNAPDAELDEEAARAISDWLDEQSTGT